MIDKPYTELVKLLTSIGVNFSHSGAAENFLLSQVFIGIHDEQSQYDAVTLYFDVDANGTEFFVCQE
jgi:hypothetical protein